LANIGPHSSFSKAFDIISHPKLFTRLRSYGVHGTVLSWLQSFLCGHTHRTRIDGIVSDIAQLISGVVQGSGIGPIMFLAYINELIYILEGFDIKLKMFADDVKLYIQIVKQLQRALPCRPCLSGLRNGSLQGLWISVVF